MEPEFILHIEQNYAKLETAEMLGTIFSCLDLTNLSQGSCEADIISLCNKVRNLPLLFPELSNVSAVCIYPAYIALAKNLLLATSVHLASVAGGFPASLTFREIKMREAEMAIAAGANELDVVMEIGKLHSTKEKDIFEEIRDYKAIIGSNTLKVILETALIKDQEKVRTASSIALEAGADFLKTSTGKEGSVADIPSVATLCQCIAEYNKKEKKQKGIKIAGGVSDTHSALKYTMVVREILGEGWLKGKLFRIGASKLANDIIDKYYTKIGRASQQNMYF